MTPSAVRLSVPAMILLLLSGCIGGLLGGGKPDQLYRFGTASSGEPPTGVPNTKLRTLVMGLPTFPPEVSADRILTSQGRELAYIKDARWVTSTPAMYQMAAEGALRSRAAVIFVDRSQARLAGGELRIAIDRFEAVYDTDPKSLPTVHIEGRATLSIFGEATPLIHRIYGEQRAKANTTGAVAAAFDRAATQSTSELTEWVSATLPPQPTELLTPR